MRCMSSISFAHTHTLALAFAGWYITQMSDAMPDRINAANGFCRKCLAFKLWAFQREHTAHTYPQTHWIINLTTNQRIGTDMSKLSRREWVDWHTLSLSRHTIKLWGSPIVTVELPEHRIASQHPRALTPLFAMSSISPNARNGIMRKINPIFVMCVKN